MSIHASHSGSDSHWSPYPVLAIAGAVLSLVVCTAFTAGGGCGTTAPPPSSLGSLAASWTIQDRAGAPTTCEQVNARSVALQLRSHATGALSAAVLPCAERQGAAPVAPGTYDVAIFLRAADGTTLATVPERPGLQIAAGRTTQLGPIAFVASAATAPRGTVVLSVATTLPKSCGARSPTNAGLTGLTLATVADGGRGGCEAATFARARGDTSLGTYQVNCGTPSVAPCGERDETFRAELPPGTYLVQLRGLRGARTCWRLDTPIVVEANRTTTRTLTMTPIAGC